MQIIERACVHVDITPNSCLVYAVELSILVHGMLNGTN